MGNKTIIDASSSKYFPDLKEVFRYKDLFRTLSWRDFRVRYAQTTIGFLWALIQPIVMLVLLTLIFSSAIGIETDVPHVLFTATGLGLWMYFAFVLANSGSSIINSQDMVKKIYFPRLIIPLSKAVVGLIDLGISILIMVVLMIYFGIAPSANFWMAPFFIIIGIIAALGVGIWLSALTIKYRDFQHVVPFIVQIGYFITPIAYPINFASDKFSDGAVAFYYLNPMAGVIQGYRWSIFGGEPPGNMIWISFAMVFVIFISSLFYFKKIEDEMADFV